MFTKKCACGDSEKNFSIDIGPFFVAECCEAKGYNHKGEKPTKPIDGHPGVENVTPEGLQQESAGLEVKDEGEQSDPSEAQPDVVPSVTEEGSKQGEEVQAPPQEKPKRRNRKNQPE